MQPRAAIAAAIDNAQRENAESTMMIDAVLPRFVQDKRACASTQLIKMRVHARHNSGSDVRHEKTLKFAEGRIVPGLGLPMTCLGTTHWLVLDYRVGAWRL